MSKISRRNFMKCAGAAALAVAASGMLAGCNVSSETLMDLQVNYTTDDGKDGSFVSQTYVGTKVVNTATIPLPAQLSNYIAVEENVPVQKKKGANGVSVSYVEIKLKLNIVDYTVNYVCGKETVLTGRLSAAAGTESFAKSDLPADDLKELEDKCYKVGEITVKGTAVTVTLEKVMGTVSVEYWYKNMFGDESRWKSGKYDETLSVWKGENSISKSQLNGLKEIYKSDSLDDTKVPETFAIDWSAPTVKVYLSY